MKTEPNEIIQSYGLTKRELFAAMAMHGISVDSNQFYRSPQDCAQRAVNQADALIKALNAISTDENSKP